MNAAYTDIIRARISGALAEAAALRGIKHNGLMGGLRETVIRQLLAPLLPTYTVASTGVLTSSQGHQSSQCDIVIYDKRLIPPILVAEAGLFPVEAVLATIEVKSELDLEGLRQAHEAALAVRNLKMVPGEHGADDQPQQHTVIRPVTAVFAFGTDLTARSELERYSALCGSTEPSLQLICVAGRECWIRTPNGWLQWQGNQQHDEVIGFLAAVVNSLAKVAESRGSPRLGTYLTDERIGTR